MYIPNVFVFFFVIKMSSLLLLTIANTIPKAIWGLPFLQNESRTSFAHDIQFKTFYSPFVVFTLISATHSNKNMHTYTNAFLREFKQLFERMLANRCYYYIFYKITYKISYIKIETWLN